MAPQQTGSLQVLRASGVVSAAPPLSDKDITDLTEAALIKDTDDIRLNADSGKVSVFRTVTSQCSI